MKRSAVVRLGACAVALAAACGPPGKKTTATRPEDPSEAVRRESVPVVTSEMIFAIARDATHLYWADLTGVHRRPLGDADAGRAKLLSDATAAWGDVTAMVVNGDRLYLSDGAQIATMPVAGGGLEPLLPDLGTGLVQPIVGLAVTSSGDLIVATYDVIARVPRAGAPVELVTAEVRITSMAVDGEHVYWTDYGEDPATVPVAGGYYGGGYYGGGDPSLFLDGPGVVRRIALSGGAIQDLATSLRGPASIAVWGGRVWWSCDRGPGVQSVPVAGGEVRVEVRGRADRIARDDAGLVVRNVNGLVSEWAGGTSGEVRMVADGRWLVSPGKPILLTPEWLYVLAMNPVDARHAVIAVPRQDESIEVVAAVSDALMRVRARDGVVWWVEALRSGTGTLISQRDPTSGESRLIARHDGYPSDIGLGDGELYFSEDASIYRVTRSGKLQRFATSNSYPVAVTVHRNHVFWSDSNQLMAKKRKGGQPFLVAQTSMYGNAELGADLVFDDDYAYLTAYGGNGTVIFRVSESGQVVTVWDSTTAGVYPIRDLASVGGELFFSASTTGGNYVVYRLGTDGEGTLLHTFGGNDRYILEMTAGGGFLYVSVVVNDTIELVRVDASNGDATTVLRWQGYAGDPGVLTADETGAYVAIEPYDAVIRIAHDAPALPAPVPLGPM